MTRITENGDIIHVVKGNPSNTNTVTLQDVKQNIKSDKMVYKIFKHVKKLKSF